MIGPNSGSLYSNPIGLSSLHVLCGLPLRLDTYKGCTIACKYCFARARESHLEKSKVKHSDPSTLGRLFKYIFEDKREKLSITSQFIKQKVPIHFGSMSDPFQPVEKKFGISFEYLKVLKRYNYPTVISTKGNIISEPKYLDLIKDWENLVIQFSITSLDPQVSRQIEPKNTNPTILLQTIEKLCKNNIKTEARWQPYIPYLNENIDEFITTIANTGVNHLSFEFLKLPRERSQAKVLKNAILETKGFDIYKVYKDLGAKNLVREFVLPKKERLPIIKYAKGVTNKNNMTFGCADNDFQLLSDLGSCCNGIEKYPGFKNWYKYQIAYALRNGNKNYLTFGRLNKEWRPDGSIDRYLNGGSRLQSKYGIYGSVENHLKHRWNGKSEGSPTYFYGITWTGKIDENGDKIYKSSL